MKTWALIALVSVSLIATSPVPAAEGKLKALIVDGQNNHSWATTTPVMKDILNASGRFTVEVATSPKKGQSLENFKPDFAAYDVIVLNYNGADWTNATQKAFEDYMAGGGGLVIVHGSDNPFSKWQAFNEMIALGGWGGRNEKSGPYVYWKDGKIVRDMSPGRGGMHGKRTPYAVDTRQPDHPIMAGLPTSWMHPSDELYAKLRGPAKNLTVLATAYSDPKTNGTGRHEPALMAIEYGKGRTFHTVLGHGPEHMHCVGFLVTFQRGTEWAATGKVTLTDVPADFPTAKKTSVREKIAAAPAAATSSAAKVIEPIQGADFSAFRGDTGAWLMAAEIFKDAANEKKLAWKPGTGAAVNGPTGRTKHLFTKAEHGDCEAHIEFMVPKSSNSGVYFQGRYEIQVFDSWGVEKPKHSDCGGIYQRWHSGNRDRSQTERGYEGRPPKVNASKAPGEWQTFDVIFKAPRFNASGQKTADAVFVKVVHNGKVIHENQEVTGPTRAAAFNDEKPLGPMMFQGDHGPVAYRNVRIVTK